MALKAVKHHKIKPSADLLGCSVSGLYAMIATGQIIAVKLNGTTLISDEEIGRVQAGLPRLIPKAGGATTPETDAAPPAPVRSA
jgi:hypothetical protein